MFKLFKNVETSKRILRCILILIFYVSILTLIALLLGYHEALIALITGVFSLATIAVGFYYWKARTENLAKIAMDLDIETYERLLKLLKEYEERSDGYSS